MSEKVTRARPARDDCLTSARVGVQSPGMARLQPSAAGPSERAVLLAALAVYAGLALFGIAGEGSTFDECAHLPAGYAQWSTGAARLNLEHPPLPKLLAALPLRFMPGIAFSTDWPEWRDGDEWSFGQRFLYVANDADWLLFWSRVPMLLLTCVLGAFIYRFTRELAGPAAASCGLLLFACTPDFLAHGALVTTDAPAATFVFITAYALYRALRHVTVASVLGCGLAFGAAVASKFSVLLFTPLLIAVPLARAWHTAPLPLGSRRALSTRLQRTAAVLLALALAAFVAWLVVWAVYGFHARAPVPLPSSAHGLAALALRAGRAQLLPGAYVAGLLSSYQQAQARVSFLLGHRSIHGFPFYFVISYLVKTPLPEIALIAAGCVLAVVRAWRGAWAYAALLVAALYYYACALAAHLNIGHRHLLPMYPFLIVLAGCAAATIIARARMRYAAFALYAWLAWGTLHIAPHYLAYFNELAGGPRGGIDFLVDSNLDWGQDLPGLKRWMDEHGVRRIYLSYFGSGMPEYYGIDYTALPSFMALARPLTDRLDPNVIRYIAVSATNLQKVYMGAIGAPETFVEFLDYLRDKREPAAVIGGSIYIYDLRAPR
jgi:hypothetical protein